jgi:hypothetical protein
VSLVHDCRFRVTQNLFCLLAGKGGGLSVRPLLPRKREISPAVNASVEEYLKLLPSPIREIVDTSEGRRQRTSRPLPSPALMDSSSLLTRPHRVALLDSVATLVDENLSGRSDMCQQFADLLHGALVHLKFPARPVVGTRCTSHLPERSFFAGNMPGCALVRKSSTAIPIAYLKIRSFRKQ